MKASHQLLLQALVSRVPLCDGFLRRKKPSHSESCPSKDLSDCGAAGADAGCNGLSWLCARAGDSTTRRIRGLPGWHSGQRPCSRRRGEADPLAGWCGNAATGVYVGVLGDPNRTAEAMPGQVYSDAVFCCMRAVPTWTSGSFSSSFSTFLRMYCTNGGHAIRLFAACLQVVYICEHMLYTCCRCQRPHVDT
jgi:hypothetical protein